MSELSVMNAMLYASANAGGFVTLAKGALESAKSALTDVGYDDVAWNGIDPATRPVVGNLPVAPTLTAVTLNLPGAPGPAPAMTLPSPIDTGGLPTLTAYAPSLAFPNKPSGIGSAPTAPAINTSFVFPEPPAALSSALPSAPVFAVRAEPTAPEIILPSFNEALPERIADAPTDGAEIMHRAYAMQSLNSQTNADAYVNAWMDKHSPEHRTQMARIEAQLAVYLAGGTGLKPAVEDAIYSRAREKNDLEAARVRSAAYSEAASRGFTLPTGALLSAVGRARQEAANNNLKAASDIVVMQAEMEQKNLQFAVTTSAGLRTAMVGAAMNYMGHVTSINAQAMDYAKSVFANVVELYNASVRVYTARIDAYKSYAAVHENQIKAATIKLDVYRAEIAALEAMTNVDQSRAAIYRVQIEGVTSLIGLYRAQIEAVQGRANLEKIKLDIFQTQTQTFGAQVQAKNSEWSGYTAAMSGEESKVRIYTAQLSAFSSQLDAYKTAISAKIAASDATTRTNQALATMHTSTVQSYTALVGAESERARAENDNNRQVLQAFDKEISAFDAQTRLQLVQYSAESEVKLKNATGDLSAQIEMARAKTQFGTTLAQLSNDGAQIYGQLAGAAMAGINTLAADVTNS